MGATPGREAAAALVRNAPAVLKDAKSYLALPEGSGEAEYDLALRTVVYLLMSRGDEARLGSEGVAGGEAVGEAAVGEAVGEAAVGEESGEGSRVIDSASADMIHTSPDVADMAAYLQARMCVPRDMGAPAAAEIRALHARLSDEVTDPPPTTEERVTQTVNRF